MEILQNRNTRNTNNKQQQQPKANRKQTDKICKENLNESEIMTCRCEQKIERCRRIVKAKISIYQHQHLFQLFGFAFDIIDN